MGDNSGIEWTTATWNPVTGCDEVSPGCDNCYAKTLAERFRGTEGHYFEAGFDLTLRPAKMDQPLRWAKPRRIFVNSMSDLFHDGISDDFIAKVFAVMALTPRHTYQLLTKRHGRMRALLKNPDFRVAVALAALEFDDAILSGPWPLPNLWLGVSVEDQKWADIRIPVLIDTPAAVRWLSMEPLLGPVDLSSAWIGNGFRLRRPPINWVVVGGESGRGARPMDPGWARSIRDECVFAGVPFFFKQWGQWAPDGDAPYAPGTAPINHSMVLSSSKKLAGRELDGRTWDEYPASASA